MTCLLSRAGFAILALGLLTVPITSAQETTPCGVVNAIDYPIDISDTFARNYDDFAVYRDRFGGNHTGIDIGFNRWGEPVMAAARGRVTYSDPEGWDTEKGVVVLEHVMPDNSIIYSLYGHMEQSETLVFPPVGACIERGQIIGGIGWPTLGRPHLHYEIRNFLPNDGGPGYVTENPLELGWYHPLEFTHLWRLRLQPGFIGAVTFPEVPAIPPVIQDNGVAVMARADTITAVYPPDDPLWRLTTDGTITSMSALPGERTIAYTRNGQAIVLEGGRYGALWQIDRAEAEAPFVRLGDALVFLTRGGGLSAFNAAGETLWSLPGTEETIDRVVYFEANRQQVALGLRANGAVTWRLVNPDGGVAYETRLDNNPVATDGPYDHWWLLDGANLDRITADGTRWTLGSTGSVPGRAANLTTDPLGNSYVYLDDNETTLLSLGAGGEPRWRVRYPYATDTFAPLLATGGGCLLYTLDADGILNVFSSTTGDLLNQVQLYAGGRQNSSPLARMLTVDRSERMLVSTGFLSLVVLDGAALTGEEAANCVLG